MNLLDGYAERYMSYTGKMQGLIDNLNEHIKKSEEREVETKKQINTLVDNVNEAVRKIKKQK
jgi:hypothetical protein